MSKEVKRTIITVDVPGYGPKRFLVLKVQGPGAEGGGAFKGVDCYEVISRSLPLQLGLRRIINFRHSAMVFEETVEDAELPKDHPFRGE